MSTMSAAQRPVVFDFGAVVFRWRPIDLMMRVLPTRATTPALAQHWAKEVFQDFKGDWGLFDAGQIEVAPLCQRIAARTGLSPEDVHAVVLGVAEELQPMPETLAVMRALHAAGHPIYFLSNMPKPLADHLEQHHPQVFGLMSDGVFSGRVGLIKPDPAIFALTLAQFGWSTEQAAQGLFIDDHPANVAASMEAGLPALRFTTAEQLRSDLQGLGFAV
ncbi:HAD family hydrolase [Ideonella paludis]|uniref:HAD family phosphatase n=1 Tax=Ideonella paludis TaxID=1233411 RepID=A0ABS5E223_9BURK|nr:HAD family phosphatase [Ideonella paludis]MBQ0937463.1 HAD family phosphatase [Ideonella paludis]